MHPKEFAQKTADDFHTLEEATDAALQSAAAMIARLIERRREANISVTVGHPVVAKLQEAQRGLMEARGAVVEAHKAAEPIQRLWRTTAQGPTDKGSSAPAGPLRAVG